MGSPFLLSLGAAAAAGAAFLFLMAVLWRRLVKHNSVNGNVIEPAASAQYGGQAAHDHPPPFDKPNDEMPAIFLSHSGAQKAFAENLYNSLRHANHTSFFDQETLSKAKPFPARIKRAAHGCKLGVIVLSEDFLTSKWPMMELKILVLDRGDDPDVLPLFYKLSPRDLKSHENLCKWRRVWKEMAGQDAEKWELAVRKLRGFNGEVFIPRTSEAAFIKKIVQLINNIIPNHSLYDLFQIKGHQRLAQEVAGRFEHANATEVCVVGLHGVGGLGKTTVCHIMVNFYNSMYLGRSCLMELPSDGNDKMIVQECKKALKRLTHLGNEFLLNEADMSLSEVVELMHKNMSGHDVFLAIDNVSERSLDAVKNVVSAVSFSAKSRVLVTSRSEQVLKDALRRLSKFSRIGPLPAPAHEEAFQIFQDMVELGDLNSLVSDKEQLNKVLERCKFSGDFHALALKALGQYVQRECEVKGSREVDHCLSVVLEKVRVAADMENVENAIRLNYENIPEKKKHMFLDIAVSFMQAVPRPYGLPYTRHPFLGLTSAKACQWLSFLYKGDFPEHMMTDLIYKFALGGLIQLEKIEGHDGSVIRVHDLYLDLAQREAATSPRFLTGRSITPVEEIEWKRLERVMSIPAKYRGQLLVERCPRLQVLYINGGQLGTIHLNLMPSLRVLKLANVSLVGIESWSAAKDLAVVQLYSLRRERLCRPIPRLAWLEELIVENCRRVWGSLEHYTCEDLKELVLVGPSSFEEAKKLRSLHVEHLRGSSTRVLDMGALILLETLHIHTCAFVERIRGFGNLKKLQRLDVKGCPRLQNLDGLSGLHQLEELHVEKCDEIKEIPNLSALPCLVSLTLDENISMEKVGGLSATLKDVSVARCGALKEFPDLSGLNSLETLRLFGNPGLEEMEGGEYHLSSTLKQLSIIGCARLRSFPIVEDCTQMQTLTARAQHMRGSLEKLAKLESVRLIGSSETRTRGTIFCEQMTQLQDVSIEECDSMELDVGILNALENLKRLTLLNCKGVERIRQMTKVPISLLRLEVRDCAALAELRDLSGLQNLVKLTVWNCPCLKKVDGYPRHLRHLVVKYGSVLEEMGDVSGLQNLATLTVIQCPRLEKVDGLMALFTHGHLTCLQIVRCYSFEAIKIPPNLVHRMTTVVDGALRVATRGNEAIIFHEHSHACKGAENYPGFDTVRQK